MAPLATSNIFARMDSECVYSPRAVPTGRPILDNRYRYNPSAELLRKLSLTELQRVNNFMVSNEYGMICWSGETDISGVDFTRIWCWRRAAARSTPMVMHRRGALSSISTRLLHFSASSFPARAARILPSDAGRAENPGNGRPIHFL